MSHKKITFYLSHLYQGGAENVMVIVANEMAKQGHVIDFVLAKAEGAFIHRLSSSVNLVDLNLPNPYFAVFGLIKYLRVAQPDVIISSLHLNNICAVLAKKFSGVKKTRVLIRVANVISVKRVSFWKKRLERLALSVFYPWADKIIAVSKNVALDLNSFLGIPNKKILVIYSPSITPEMMAASHEPVDHAWFQSNYPPVVLGVGRQTVVKDYATLLKAFALASKEKDMRLLLLGDGPERLALEELVKELGIENKVEIKGFVDNPFNYMRNAAVMVLPSLWEGLPNVLIEALACGCPIISTDSPGGVREILKDGEYGELVPLRDAQTISDKILDVLRGEKKPIDEHWLEQFKVEYSIKQYLHAMME
ncbi:MAG TPA: glycosyl transferase [Flavobacterium sp.]|nr:glycosyl transferase [Flavobacterium sp.]